MLWTIFVILLVLWLLGMVSSYTLGGFIHILLVVALAILLTLFLEETGPAMKRQRRATPRGHHDTNSWNRKIRGTAREMPPA